MIKIERSDPREAGATALLRQSHTLMQSLFAPEDNHFLDIDALCADDVRFFTAIVGADVVGTAALKIQVGYGEIKSMFVAETARGTGVADALMRQLEDQARDDNLSLLRLETGDVLYAAHKLYARHGFTNCGPFGDYALTEASVFMEKRL